MTSLAHQELAQELLQFYTSALEPWPLTRDEIEDLVHAIRLDPRTDSDNWRSSVERIKAARLGYIVQVLQVLRSLPQQVVDNDRFQRSILPSDWERRMHVLSDALQRKTGENMTIGIPGCVAKLRFEVPSTVNIHDALKYMTMNPDERRKTYGLWSDDAFLYFFQADSSIRPKDLINAYRARDDEERRMWGVTDSARTYLSELEEIASNPANASTSYLRVKLTAFKRFRRFNRWLTEKLKEELRSRRAQSFRPPNPSVYVCDETGDIECHAEPVS